MYYFMPQKSLNKMYIIHGLDLTSIKRFCLHLSETVVNPRVKISIIPKT